MAQDKQEYKKANIEFLKAKRQENGVEHLSKGVLYKVLKQGEGKGMTTPGSVVSCYYKGSLINGKVFDNTFDQGYAEALRVRDLIDGFQIALLGMHIGDRWEVYIPSTVGYGEKKMGDIPGNSTLIFEIEVVAIV
ncbi:MAG: FKBP-type peptidyl-prolyl cis-trans isomerase [Bacteroidales bacterium]|nr:FKBP-type peptidyl-prolyl cis-trans isomerase [Bacteroidales bacterium]